MAVGSGARSTASIIAERILSSMSARGSFSSGFELALAVFCFDIGQNVFTKRINYRNRKDFCNSIIAVATLDDEVLNENDDLLHTSFFSNMLIQAFSFPASQHCATLFADCGEQVALGSGDYKLAMMQDPKLLFRP